MRTILRTSALVAPWAFVASALSHEPLPDPSAELAGHERAHATIERPLERTLSSRPLLAKVDAFGRRLVLELGPSPIIAPGATMERLTDGAVVGAVAGEGLFQGVVVGEVDSAAAVSLHGGTFAGLVRIGSEILMFEPAVHVDPHAPAGELIAYRLADIRGVPAADELRAYMARRPERPAERASQVGGPFPAVLDVAAVADFEFFQEHGSGATQRMLDVINQVDVIYVDQLNVTLRVTHTKVFETSNDPFSVFNSGNLFNDFRDTATEFGQYRDSTGGAVEAAGVAHLFSDKFGINAGFGFIDVLCSKSRGVSISTNNSNLLSIHALIVAHEFGHNFGAQHDGEAGSSCVGAPGGFIMAPSATGNAFSDCSKAIMTANAEDAVCIVEGTGTTTTSTTLPDEQCAQPVTTGASPAASDCLFILRAAVGAGTCAVPCICAPKGTLPITATDALLCLKAAVGQTVTLNCPC